MVFVYWARYVAKVGIDALIIVIVLGIVFMCVVGVGYIAVDGRSCFLLLLVRRA